jgi:tetratricopeptide (TPR) repeat protein
MGKTGNGKKLVFAVWTIGLQSLLISVLWSNHLGMSQSWAASANQTSASQYRQLGLSYRQQQRFSEAIAALQQAVALDPDNLPGRVSLGWTLHLDRQDRSAARILEQTVQRHPYHVPALNALGIVYLVNGDLAGAVMAHKWAATLDPNNEIAYYNLSLAFQRLKQYDWAIETATQATKLEPDNPHPFVALAIAHWGKDEQAIAQQIYQEAIGLDSRYRSSSFLDGLTQAGFSPDQTETTKQVLNSLY